MGLKNLFFKDVEVKSEKDSKPHVHGAVFSPNPTQGVTSVYSPETATGIADEKFVAMLESVVANNNIPGLDYIEFKQAVEKMASLPIDETNKFLSVYSIFETQGCSKQTLLNSIDKYISLIKNEQETFNSEIAVSFNENVEKRKQEIENAKEEITKLNNKIVELNGFIMSTTQEVQQEEMKLKMADSNFKQSVQRVVSVMESDKNKISTYIK